MGIKNVQGGLEDRISVYKGELEEVEAEIKRISDGIDSLCKLRRRATKLRRLIMGAEDIILEANPEWQKNIKARRKGQSKLPFKSGEIGMRALATLRERDRWMRPRDIAIELLTLRGRENERDLVDRVTNAIGSYFSKHKGDLVESRGDYAKDWRLIREISEMPSDKCEKISVAIARYGRE